jgi:hypothetical protein
MQAICQYPQNMVYLLKKIQEYVPIVNLIYFSKLKSCQIAFKNRKMKRA